MAGTKGSAKFPTIISRERSVHLCKSRERDLYRGKDAVSPSCSINRETSIEEYLSQGSLVNFYIMKAVSSPGCWPIYNACIQWLLLERWQKGISESHCTTYRKKWYLPRCRLELFELNWAWKEGYRETAISTTNGKVDEMVITRSIGLLSVWGIKSGQGLGCQLQTYHIVSGRQPDLQGHCSGDHRMTSGVRIERVKVQEDRKVESIREPSRWL